MNSLKNRHKIPISSISKYFSLLIILGFHLTYTQVYAQTIKENNAELTEIYTSDQADRQANNIDWPSVTARDLERQSRVLMLLDSGKVKTSTDYNHAAMIFQHGGNSAAYKMAVKLMRKSIELDSTANKWLLAAAIDRYLLSVDSPQIYGTQYVRYHDDEKWVQNKIDTTQVSDKQRKEYGVRTLARQREMLKEMNLYRLNHLQDSGVPIEKIIKLLEHDEIDKDQYNLSESGINSFGYSLIRQGDTTSALAILRLNTIRYPNAFNTHDSYGECLLLLGRKEEGLAAYKKSLQLNPNNTNASKIIAKYETKPENE